MKQIVILILILLPAINVTGQSQNIDSLINVLNTKKLTPDHQLELYDKIGLYYMGYDLEKGIEYAEKGLHLAEKEKNKKMASVFNKHLGIAYYNQSSFDTSRIYLDKSLALALEIEDEPAQMAAYGVLGNLYRLKQDYQTSLDYYMKALSLHDVPANQTRSSILNNIGIIHRILNNPDRAVYFLEQALEMAEQLDLDPTRMSAYHGLGTIYADKKDYAKATEYMQKTLDVSWKLGNKPYEILSTMALASNFAADKEYGKALDYAQKGLNIAETFGNPRYILGAWGALADIYEAMGQYKACEEAARKAWSLDSVSVEEGSLTAMTLAVANVHLGQKERAEYFIHKFYDIIQEGNDKSLHNSLANMEVKYETEKKEMLITSLEKERQLYAWLGAAGFLLVFALAIALWQTVKNARKEKQLIATRSVLDGEMKERTRLAQDLHDRLSGNLSAVKIELGNQAESMQDVREKLDNCIWDIRNAAHNLMPTSLQFGMKVALEDYAAQFSNVRFHFFGEEKRIDRRLEFVIYCCASELVNNAIKHSGAENINLQLVQDAKHVTLTVSDDGCGYNEKDAVKGFGLKSIRDRVASCDGKMDIITSPGDGTETTIELKIHNA